MCLPCTSAAGGTIWIYTGAYNTALMPTRHKAPARPRGLSEPRQEPRQRQLRTAPSPITAGATRGSSTVACSTTTRRGPWRRRRLLHGSRLVLLVCSSARTPACSNYSRLVPHDPPPGRQARRTRREREHRACHSTRARRPLPGSHGAVRVAACRTGQTWGKNTAAVRTVRPACRRRRWLAGDPGGHPGRLPAGAHHHPVRRALPGRPDHPQQLVQRRARAGAVDRAQLRRCRASTASWTATRSRSSPLATSNDLASTRRSAALYGRASGLASAPACRQPEGRRRAWSRFRGTGVSEGLSTGSRANDLCIDAGDANTDDS